VIGAMIDVQDAQEFFKLGGGGGDEGRFFVLIQRRIERLVAAARNHEAVYIRAHILGIPLFRWRSSA
jgi:hypothetical protein